MLLCYYVILCTYINIRVSNLLLAWTLSVNCVVNSKLKTNNRNHMKESPESIYYRIEMRFLDLQLVLDICISERLSKCMYGCVWI